MSCTHVQHTKAQLRFGFQLSQCRARVSALHDGPLTGKKAHPRNTHNDNDSHTLRTHTITQMGPAQIRGTEATYGTSVYMCLHPMEHAYYLVTTQKLTNQGFSTARANGGARSSTRQPLRPLSPSNSIQPRQTIAFHVTEESQAFFENFDAWAKAHLEEHSKRLFVKRLTRGRWKRNTSPA